MRFLVLLLVIAMGSTAIADRRGTPAPIDRRETIKKKIRALRAYTLTEELGLDDATSAKLFPVLARWDDITDKLLVTRADLTRQLQAVDSINDPKAVNKLIDDAVANQKAFWDLEDRRLAELRKILSPAQTAKLVLVLPAFERRIQNQLRKAIQNRRGGAVRGGRGGDLVDIDPEDFDDDPYGDRDGAPARGAPPGATPPRGTPAPTPAPKKCDPFSSVRANCR